MPLLNSKYDFDEIAARVQAELTRLACGANSVKNTYELLSTLFNKTFIFTSDPIGWHFHEIGNRIKVRLKLDPRTKQKLWPTEAKVHELKPEEHQCTRSTIPTERIGKDLMLRSVCNALIHLADSDEIKHAAEKIILRCPQLKPTLAPFVDDPPCKCKNCDSQRKRLQNAIKGQIRGRSD